MNNLSWFIYLADVIPALGGLAVFLSFFLGVGIFFYLLLAGVEDYAFQGVVEGSVKPKYSLIILCLSLMLFSVFLPSREALYLIAGSETAEAVATSEVGQEVLDDIHEVIQAQLDNLKEKN